MADVTSICNRSLLGCGARTQISGFPPGDGSIEAQACATLFQPTFEQLGRTARWNCLRKELALGLIAAAPGTPENVAGDTYPTPPIPWLYTYSYPVDCLAMQYVMPTFPLNTNSAPPALAINNAAATWLPNGGQIPFVVSTWADSNGNPILVILTNQCQATAVYTMNQPNPAIWDSMFQQAMVASLAAFLAPALTLSEPLMQTNIKLAESIIAQARAADGNEGVTVMDHLPDWIAARAGSTATFYGFGSPGWSGFNLYSMNWPGAYYS